ncbi:hypothetical protein [Rhizobium sp. Leaf341]|uniref:hypothetical protein n=1 Tax=Rhizobium sp. Leaf341 TaxID=1736344 RepID=UPI0012E38F59|nr:hypothetical protein [Rhizobium sp. Leaf341]
MGDTCDCDNQISLEHPLSKSILKQWEEIGARGFRDADPEKDVIIGINSHGGNILCKRHNECLAPLDEMAGKLYAELREKLSPLHYRQTVPAPNWIFIDGSALESWACKLAAGTFAMHGVTVKGVRQPFTLDFEKINRAIWTGLTLPGEGLYLLGARTARMQTSGGSRARLLLGRRSIAITTIPAKLGFS